MTDDLGSAARMVFFISLVPAGCICVSMNDTKCGCFGFSMARLACSFFGFAALMLYDITVMSDVVIVSCVLVFLSGDELSISSGDVCVLEVVVVCCCVCGYVSLCVLNIVFRG